MWSSEESVSTTAPQSETATQGENRPTRRGTLTVCRSSRPATLAGRNAMIILVGKEMEHIPSNAKMTARMSLHPEWAGAFWPSGVQDARQLYSGGRLR